jgi:hypothetical protein
MDSLKRKFYARSLGPNGPRLLVSRNPETGNWEAGPIVSKKGGKVLVKAGPITGARTRTVLRPSKPTRLPRAQLKKLVDSMRLVT